MHEYPKTKDGKEIVGTISHLTGRDSFYCTEHAKTMEEIQQLYDDKYIFGYLTTKDAEAVLQKNGYITCIICKKRLEL